MTATMTKEQSPIILRYRPQEFNEVLGNTAMVKSIEQEVNSPGRPHTWLFTGLSGIGKTTLARIIAAKVGCIGKVETGGGLLELDGATSSGVDDIRELTRIMDYMPQKGKAKVAIIDECHAISKAAWQAFLKSTEDVPHHAYYIFATSEASKVPAALKTRATTYDLKPVPTKTLFQYGRDVICPLEGINLSDDILQLVADSAGGSPRQFLNFLSQVRTASSIEDAKSILSVASADETDPIIQLARMLVGGQTNVGDYLAVIGEIQTFGGARAILRSYISKAARSNWQHCHMLLEMLDKMPLFPQEKDGAADLQLLIYRVVSQLNKQRS